jgi:hypothetical protein
MSDPQMSRALYRRFQDLCRSADGAATIRTFDFREQWRFPRSRKRRIRKKWAAQACNWRSRTRQCFVSLRGHRVTFFVSPDVKAAIEAELSKSNKDNNTS